MSISATPLLEGLSLRISCRPAQKYMYKNVYQGSIPGEKVGSIGISINSREENYSFSIQCDIMLLFQKWKRHMYRQGKSYKGILEEKLIKTLY